MSRGSKKRPKETKPSLAAEWRAWYESKGPVLRFVSKFAVLIALFYGVLATTYLDRAFYAYLEANAWLSNFLLD
ncbi:MAG TPA: hypothetical protein VL981_09605, partial [Candidatus Methylacidiphilales bacterium]|nr:hypothetical protein [Candidatus Methylacidiphilales bacterium]